MAGTSRDPDPPNTARSFADGVLQDELKCIAERRARVLLHPPVVSGSAADSAQETSAFGVAFSGGGIRSATFNLGVIQGLAEKGILPYIDYLSTVSGGGYIGGWLHGVIRSLGGHPAAARDTLLAGIDRPPGPPDTDPITFLRKYSNYLAPRPGLFSADSWVGLVIWLRNVLLNQLILIPAIATLAILALLLVLVRQAPFFDERNFGFNPVSGAVAIAGLLLAVIVMTANLRPIARQSVASEPIVKNRYEILAERYTVLVLAGVLLAACALAYGDFDAHKPRVLFVTGGVIFLLMLVIQCGGGFIECFAARHSTAGRVRAVLHVIWMSAVSGIVTTILVRTMWTVIDGRAPWTVMAFALPLIAFALMTGVMLLVGLMGADYPDAAREWTARTGSRFAMAAAAWAGLFALTVFGPWLVGWLLGHAQRIGITAIAAWIMTTAGGVLAGQSAQTENGGGSGIKRALEWLVNIAPTVFLIGYVIAIAAGVHFVYSRLAPSAPIVEGMPYAERYFLALRTNYAAEGWSHALLALVLLLLTVAVALVAASRIDVNEFSLHHAYKNRLVRCYLGASRAAAARSAVTPPRDPNPLTGFDPLDDFPLAKLRPDAGQPGHPYLGPYPIVNAALNLNTGSELAQLERKATSFIFTPAFCGFDPPSSRESTRQTESEMDRHGYRVTAGYSQPGGPDLGTAFAISGAAANPNSGYHTSGPMAFLLTVFDARLGWWVGNPRWRKPSTHSGPRFALKYLLAELLGQTTGRSKFVNLSDGGHFDNLGLYELVRRRCRFIIVCDAEEDGNLTFGSLGGAIRKCRADFGVEIEIDPSPIHAAAGALSRTHCVVGRIRYPEDERAFVAGMTGGLEHAGDARRPSYGWLVYLKSSLTGDEPSDVLEYRARFAEFPHQSTANQFFSESQFESYRRLGYHVLRSAFADVWVPADATRVRQDPKRNAADPNLLKKYPLVPMFQELTRKWYATAPISPEATSRLADAYVALMARLAERKTLSHLYGELLHGRTSARPTTPSGPPDPELMAFGIEIMQLIENVYTEFGFESAFNEQNPRNAGWINLFRGWLRSDILYKDIWPAIAHTYQPFFQRFVERLRNPADAEPTRL